MDREQPSFYAILPATVRYDTRLKPIERLLYAEITALTNKEGYCFASNAFFANLYGCTERAITGYITSLKNCGYLDVVIANYNERKIFLREKELSTGGEQTFVGRSENSIYGGVEKTFHHNNTSINNTSINNTLCSEQLKNSSEQYANVPALILNDKSEHRITISDLNRYKELYPAVDVEQAIRSMAGWLDANPSKRKTKRGINKFINSWLSREQDRGGNQKGKVVVNRQRTDGNYYDLIAEEE